VGKQKRRYNIIILLFCLSFFSLFILSNLAPILKYLKVNSVANFLYTFFGFFCHQMYTRSLHIFDYQVAVCARDEFMYLSMGIAALFVYLKHLKPIKWWLFLILVLPAAFDGTIQLIGSMLKISYGDNLTGLLLLVSQYSSTNLIRALTGTLMGCGFGYFLFPLLESVY